MKSTLGLAMVAVALVGAAPQSAVAQHRESGRAWRGDIRHFESHDSHRWRSGAWRHGAHRGHVGWWWVAGGLWYSYPRPVYPFPDPYRPSTIVIEQSQPTFIVQSPAPAQAMPQEAPAPAAQQFWYYCDAAKAYYPYVASCPSGWKTVPAIPTGVPQ